MSAGVERRKARTEVRLRKQMRQTFARYGGEDPAHIEWDSDMLDDLIADAMREITPLIVETDRS